MYFACVVYRSPASAEAFDSTASGGFARAAINKPVCASQLEPAASYIVSVELDLLSPGIFGRWDIK